MILSRGHKLRYANQFVGAFILLVVGLLFVGYGCFDSQQGLAYS